MKLKSIITSIFFLGALFTGTALAAEEPAAGETGALGLGQEIAAFHKADDLKDQSVVSLEGEELGKIDNLVISNAGDVFIVLSRNDSGDMVAIPWEAANLFKGEDDKYTAHITEQQLEGAPSFQDYSELESAGYEQEVHSYFGTDTQMDGFQQETPGLQDESPQMEQPGTVN
jgi:hypothetical protein